MILWVGVDGISEEVELGGCEGGGLAAEEEDCFFPFFFGLLDLGEEGGMLLLLLLGWRRIGGHGDID